MSPAKILVTALCLLYWTLPLVAQRPSGGRLIRDDNDSRPTNPSQESRMTIPEEVGGKTYNDWKGDLLHRDPAARGRAILALLAFGSKSLEAVPALIPIVKNAKEDAGVKSKVLLALKVMGSSINSSDREKAIKTLGSVLSNDSDSVVRYEAVQTLLALMADGKAAKAASSIIGDLVKGVGDPRTYETRQACIMALIACTDREKGPEPRVTDVLILHTKTYYEPSNEVRMQAIIALGAMGRPRDPKKLEQVKGALHDHDRSSDTAIKIWTRVSLMALEDEVNEKDINLIVRSLNDPNREVRKQAVTALGALGTLGAMEKKTSKHVKDICTRLETEEETMVQEAACRTLARMGDTSDHVLRALIRLTVPDKQKTNGVVLAACAALARLHVASPEVKAAMKAVREHKTLSDTEMSAVEEYIRILESPLRDAPKARNKADKK